jgi:hypothetical protein
MIGSSIYLRDRAAFTGGSPQAVYEELWQQGRQARLRTRAIISLSAMVLCGLLVNAVFGLVVGALVGLADIFVHWRVYHSSRVWRHGLRGEEQMARLLKYTLERRGHRVLHARTVPGHGSADQLVFGRGGIWLVHNEAWDPEAEITHHGGRLFVNGRTQSRLVKELTGRAAEAGRLISDASGIMVKVTPVLAVHCGDLVRTPFTADGITFAPPFKLVRGMGRNPSGDHTAEDVERLTRAAVHALPIGGRSMTQAA